MTKIALNGVEIKRVKSCKYLGVIIDDELKFDVHIDYIYNRLIRYVGIFYKLAQKLPYFCRRNIYYAFVNTQIAFGIEIPILLLLLSTICGDTCPLSCVKC